jgi:ribosomal protein S18 acetylase RimI-like enzyme
VDTLIRPATAADLPVLVEFNARLAAETEGKTLAPAVLQRGVARLLADPAKGFYTVAERADEVVGCTLVTFEWSDWRDGFYWWVQSVYVRADCRRLGVFRAVFAHLRGRAEADPDVIGIRLYVERNNHRAQATYADLGLTTEPYHLMGLYPLRGSGRPAQPRW